MQGKEEKAIILIEELSPARQPGFTTGRRRGGAAGRAGPSLRSEVRGEWAHWCTSDQQPAGASPLRSTGTGLERLEADQVVIRWCAEQMLGEGTREGAGAPLRSQCPGRRWSELKVWGQSSGDRHHGQNLQAAALHSSPAVPSRGPAPGAGGLETGFGIRD